MAPNFECESKEGLYLAQSLNTSLHLEICQHRARWDGRELCQPIRNSMLTEYTRNTSRLQLEYTQIEVRSECGAKILEWPTRILRPLGNLVRMSPSLDRTFR